MSAPGWPETFPVGVCSGCGQQKSPVARELLLRLRYYRDRGLDAIYKTGFKYAKAGVMLLELQPATMEQGELELEVELDVNRARLMVAMDAINQRYGRGTVHLASAGVPDVPKGWGMRQERRTPRYTTRVGELVKAGC